MRRKKGIDPSSPSSFVFGFDGGTDFASSIRFAGRSGKKGKERGT